MQKSIANDLCQEVGIREGRRREESYPFLLRQLILMYTDVAVLVQRIFTADKTMDPTGALKAQTPLQLSTGHLGNTNIPVTWSLPVT